MSPHIAKGKTNRTPLQLIVFNQQDTAATQAPSRRATDVEQVADDIETATITDAQLQTAKHSRPVTPAESQYYFDLFEYAPAAYLVTSPEGIIRQANRAAAELLGLPQEWLAGKPLSVFVLRQHHTLLFDYLSQLRAGQRQTFDLSMRPRHGQIFPAAIDVSALFGAQGQVAALCWLVRDNTRQKQEAESHSKEHDIQIQYRAIITERERISRELHDSLGQVLGWLNLKTEQAQALLRQNQVVTAGEVLAEMLATLQRTYIDVREEIRGLRSAMPVEKDLQTILAEYLAEFSRNFAIETHLAIGGGTPNHLSPVMQTQILRIIQEALHNVRKHAGARHVSVSFRAAGEHLVITVEDDGLGFRNESRPNTGFGLTVMRERAQSIGGRLSVESTPGQGTRVALFLPRAA